MTSRIVRVYDEPMPTVEDMIFPFRADRPRFPNEAWSSQMQADEVALFCVNFKNGLPVTEETGMPCAPPKEETCRVFSDFQSAEAYGRSIVKAHPSTICVLRSKDEQELKRISNRRFLNSFAFASLSAMALWLALATGIGLAVIWLVGALASSSGFQWVLSLSAWQWFGLIMAATVLGVISILLMFYLSAQRKMSKFEMAISTGLSPDEKQRYAEINSLSASSNPQDWEKARELAKEYSARIRAIRRDMK